MFERFTGASRAVVIGARRQAAEMGHPRVGTEHLLLALLDEQSGLAHTVLTDAGLTHNDVRARITAALAGPAPLLGPDDAEALKSIGIDLESVLARIEQSFGPQAAVAEEPERESFWQRLLGSGSLFTPRARKVLELSLREAIRLKSREIGTEHILLGLLREGQGLGARVIVDAGCSMEALRVATLAELADA